MLQVDPVDLCGEVRREPLGGFVELPGEHEPAGLDGFPGDGEAERVGFAQQPVEAVVEPVPARRVEPAHVVAQGGSGEGVGAARDEFAQRRGNAVAPALGQAQPAALGRLERPRGAEVGLEPERSLARDQPGLVGAMEQAGQLVECGAARLGEALRVGQRESALGEFARGLRAELGEELGGGRDGGVARTRTSAARGCCGRPRLR